MSDLLSRAETCTADETFVAEAMATTGARTYRELERAAGMAPNTLSKAVCGSQDLGPFARAKLDVVCGRAYAAEHLARWFGEKASAWLAESPAGRTRLVESSALKDDLLLEGVGRRYSFSQAQIAAVLGVSRTVVTDANTGRQQLKMEHRLALAYMLGFGWARETLSALAPDLLSAVEQRLGSAHRTMTVGGQ